MHLAAPEPGSPRASGPPVRDPEAPRRVTLLELFFDLVYVVALALISRGMVDQLDWHRGAEALIMLAAVWWTWAITTLVTDLYNPERTEIKLLISAVMFGALLMTTAIPEAFNARGLVFAGTYVAIHLGRGLFLMPAVRREPQTQRRAARIFVWFAVSAIPWLIGAFVSEDARIACWAIALAIDYLGFRLAYPVPGLGVVPEKQRNVTAEHLSERYQQFFIIALGDAILTIGTMFSMEHNEAENIGAFAVAFLTTLLLWRIYVHKSGELLPTAIQAARVAQQVPVQRAVHPSVDDRRRGHHGGRLPPGAARADRADATGLAGGDPRRPGAVPGRPGLVRVRGVQPGVVVPTRWGAGAADHRPRRAVPAAGLRLPRRAAGPCRRGLRGLPA